MGRILLLLPLLIAGCHKAGNPEPPPAPVTQAGPVAEKIEPPRTDMLSKPQGPIWFGPSPPAMKLAPGQVLSMTVPTAPSMTPSAPVAPLPPPSAPTPREKTGGEQKLNEVIRLHERISAELAKPPSQRTMTLEQIEQAQARERRLIEELKAAPGSAVAPGS